MAGILISGGTGLIGTRLSKALIEVGHKVKVLTRAIPKDPSGTIEYVKWDVEKKWLDPSALFGIDAIIHLAGENVATKRWTAKRKEEIFQSRVQSTRVLTEALRNQENRVRTFISASAIGWYGPDQSSGVPFIESDPPFDDFLGSTVKEWEDAVDAAAIAGRRVVKVRTGIVLSNDGGAYVEFKKSLPFGVATILGSGHQVVSWIHIDDLIEIYINAINQSSYQGIFNGVAPHPVSNEKLVTTIANVKKKKSMKIHVPAWTLKAVLGELSIEVLKSATVSAEKLIDAGFEFQFPTIEEAVNDLETSAHRRD